MSETGSETRSETRSDAAKSAGRARVQLRDVQLAAAAEIWPETWVATPVGSDQAIFIALDQPPPVRTVVTLHAEDGSSVTAMITAVAESDSSHPRGRVGCEACIVSDEVRERAWRVGTEHHDAGERPHTTATEGASDVGMPAPVMEPEPSEPIEPGTEHIASEAELSGQRDAPLKAPGDRS